MRLLILMYAFIEAIKTHYYVLVFEIIVFNSIIAGFAWARNLHQLKRTSKLRLIVIPR